MTSNDTIITKSHPRYAVMTSSCTPAASCTYPYVRIAVVELAPGFEGVITMISTRAKGVRRVVETWENLSCGGRKSAQGKAIARATDLADALNGVWGPAAQSAAQQRI